MLTRVLYLMLVLGGILLFSALTDFKAHYQKLCAPLEASTSRVRTPVSL